MAKAKLTASLLRELLSYDPETGLFRWIANAGANGRIPAGSVAGSKSKNHCHGYVEILVGGHRDKAHRLAWLYMTGEWPLDEVDHKNRIRDDNRWSNLRPCSRAKNPQNQSMYVTNTSGFAGVTWHKRAGKWQARIGVATARRHLGYFDDVQQAATAYAQAKAVFHRFDEVSSCSI